MALAVRNRSCSLSCESALSASCVSAVIRGRSVSEEDDSPETDTVAMRLSSVERRVEEAAAVAAEDWFIASREAAVSSATLRFLAGSFFWRASRERWQTISRQREGLSRRKRG